MLGSAIMQEGSSMLQLEKSVIMIEKDLGIEGETDSISDRLGLSTVISRSLLVGEFTPARTDKAKD
jgi:propanediol dehydratase large subunit